MKRSFNYKDRYDVIVGRKYITIKDNQTKNELKSLRPAELTEHEAFMQTLIVNFNDIGTALSEAVYFETMNDLYEDIHKFVEKYPTLLVDMQYSKVLMKKFKARGRIVGNYIFDNAGRKHNGFVTLDALKLKVKLGKKFKKSKDWCDEHVHAKQPGGEFIIKEAYAGKLTHKRFDELVDTFCEVAQSTSSENMQLKEYQKSTHNIFNWKANYTAIGSILYELVGGYYGDLTHVIGEDGATCAIEDLC